MFFADTTPRAEVKSLETRHLRPEELRRREVLRRPADGRAAEVAGRDAARLAAAARDEHLRGADDDLVVADARLVAPADDEREEHDADGGGLGL